MKIRGKEINKKWFENYWYYYKIHTIAGIFILILLVYSIVECANKVNPDATVSYIGALYFGEEFSADFEQKLSDCIDDIDGDGIKKIIFNSLTLSDDVKSELDIAMQQKVQLEIAVGETYLYFMDKKYFDIYNEQGIFLDISEHVGEEGEPVYGIKAGKSPILHDLGIKEDTDVYVALRVMTAGDEKKAYKAASHANAVKIIKELYKTN